MKQRIHKVAVLLIRLAPALAFVFTASTLFTGEAEIPSSMLDEK